MSIDTGNRATGTVYNGDAYINLEVDEKYGRVCAWTGFYDEDSVTYIIVNGNCVYLMQFADAEFAAEWFDSDDCAWLYDDAAITKLG